MRDTDHNYTYIQGREDTETRHLDIESSRDACTSRLAAKGTMAFLQQLHLEVVRVKELVAVVALDDGFVGQNDLEESPSERRGPFADEDVCWVN